MMKFLKITLVVLTTFGIAGSALAQEAASAKGDHPSYSVRFDHEADDGVMANLAKVKQNGIGYQFGEGSTFGVQIKNGVEIGFKIRFF